MWQRFVFPLALSISLLVAFSLFICVYASENFAFSAMNMSFVRLGFWVLASKARYRVWCTMPAAIWQEQKSQALFI